MTSGFKYKIVGSSRLIGGLHGVRACSGVFQALSLSLPSLGPPSGEVNGARFGSLERLLRDVLACRRCLPMWGSKVDGLAYPRRRPMAHNCLLRGHGLPVRCHPVSSR
jgi:hypothetical protein